MPSALVGSSPHASFSTQPTINQTQQGLLGALVNALLSGTVPAGVTSFTNPANPPTYSAPLSDLQNQSLAALSGVTGGALPTAAQGQVTAAALPALMQAFGFQAPQYAAPTIPSAGQQSPPAAQPSNAQAAATAPSTGLPSLGGPARTTTPGNVDPETALLNSAPTQGAPGTAQTALSNLVTPTTGGPLQPTPLIDATSAFQTGVAAPLLQDFQQQILPAISGALGRSAGGAYGSGAPQQEQLAATNLDRTLAQQGALYSLGAQQANQQALQGTNLANLQSILSTQAGNQAGALSGQNLALSALGLTPSVVGAQQAPYANAANILASTLQSGGVPQQQQQTQLAGEWQNFVTQLQQAQALYQIMAGVSTAPTQQTVGVGTGGSSGLLGGLLGSSGVTNAIGSGITALFSDRRLKEDYEQVGELENGLPIYIFRYRGDPTPRLGLMADEVERVVPEAVHETPSGYKAVNYALAALKEL